MTGSNRSRLWLYFIYLPIIVALFVILGGLAEYWVEKDFTDGKIKTAGDGIWWAFVTLTTVGYGDLYPTTIPGRIIASFLMFLGIGILGVFTAGTAAYFVRNDLTQRFRLRNLRDHVVICGLGEKGLLLTKAFRERGLPVLVIESNENNDHIGVCEEQGCLVLVGDAAHPAVLTVARLPYARCLIAVCGQDGTNAKIAAHARHLALGRMGSPLTCATHIVDPDLWYLLRRWELAATGDIRLQFFNVLDVGAQVMLNTFPPFPESGLIEGRPPHLLVVGAGPLGQSMAIHAARRWRENPASAQAPMRLTLLDRDTTHLHDHLHLRHVGLEKICTMDTQSVDVQSPAFHRGAFLFDVSKRFSVTAIYICMEDDAQGLSAALALHHHARRHRIPIVIRTDQEGGLSELLGNVQGGGRDFENLHAFPLLLYTCQPDFVLGGTHEALARAIHARYLRDQAINKPDAHANNALVPWEELSEELKESNRRAADHITLQLQTVGCDLAPLTEWDAGKFRFTAEEIEHMAIMEHERWRAERQKHGWTLGPRDPEKKTNPNLVQWEELPEEGKLSNRETIREMPAALARAGFQIYRLAAGHEV